MTYGSIRSAYQEKRSALFIDLQKKLVYFASTRSVTG
jgi:hypothetical protein